MKRLRILVMFSLLFAATGAPAQTTVSAAAGDAAPGAIVLPQKLVAGEPATLAVIGADGRLIPNIQVEFSGGVSFTTD